MHAPTHTNALLFSGWLFFVGHWDTVHGKWGHLYVCTCAVTVLDFQTGNTLMGIS